MAFTYFFRDLQTLEFIVESLIPFVSGKQSVKIWDAGCASGQEPYTLSILLAEKMGQYSYRNLKIYATDIDISNQFEKMIVEAKYPYQELQRIPEPLFKKYFQQTDVPDEYQAVQVLRERLIFMRQDLLKLQPAGSEFSLVLCKNVLLHFQENERIAVLKMFHQALTTGGFLAMEQTQDLPKEVSGLFERVMNNAQLYRKKQE